MSPSENLKVEQDLYVNEATLELLQRRVASRVRTGFFMTVTLPIGGGGIAALVWAVIAWIPVQVDQFLENPMIKDRIDQAVVQRTDALVVPQIQATVDEELEPEVLRHLPSEVAKFLEGEQGARILTRNVAEAVARSLESQEMDKRLSAMVVDYLRVDGRELLVQQISDALQPAVVRLSTTIDDNGDQLVEQLTPESLVSEAKRSESALRDFLREKNVRRIKSQQHPVVLTKTIRANNYYQQGLIERYLREFAITFGNQFKYVAIYSGAENSKRLLALVPATQFTQLFQAEPSQIMKLLLANPTELSDAQAARQLGQWFGIRCLRQINDTAQVNSVLRDTAIWSSSQTLDDEVAVVNARGVLRATTTRRKLIDGILQEFLN